MIYEVETESDQYPAAIDQAMTVAVGLLQLPENVYVTLTLGEEYSSAGGCVHCDDEDGYMMFDVDININQDIVELITTLFHELKHVEQYATGRLTQTNWLGKKKPVLEYYERPWEKEAYKFESEAMQLYRRQYDG